MLIICSYDLLYFYSIVCNFFSFIYDFIFGGIFFSFLMSLAKFLSILYIFSKCQLSVSLIFPVLIFSFCFIYFYTDLYFFLFTNLWLYLFFVSPFKFFYLRFFSFWRRACITMDFLLRSALAASHRFWNILFPFHLLKVFFKFHFSFLHWQIIV